MTIATWPVVDRSRVVHAFKPAEPSSAEAPFRTLRHHGWSTAGVRLTRRSGGRLGGQMTIFSSLNVEAARLARRGVHDVATRLARAAHEIESSAEFGRLRTILSELPTDDAQSVVSGVFPNSARSDLADTIRVLARLTEQVRAAEDTAGDAPATIVGRVTEVSETSVVLFVIAGSVVLPRWMARDAQRDKVGEAMALVTDKLDNASAVVEAMPAIDVDEDSTPYSPFDRGDRRTLVMSADDARRLVGSPEPLRVIVPVLIEE